MMKITKATSRFLLLALAAALLAGCGGEAAPAGDTTAADVTDAVTTVDPNSPEGRKLVDDELPAKDYGGKEFRILTSEQKNFQFVSLVRTKFLHRRTKCAKINFFRRGFFGYLPIDRDEKCSIISYYYRYDCLPEGLYGIGKNAAIGKSPLGDSGDF